MLGRNFNAGRENRALILQDSRPLSLCTYESMVTQKAILFTLNLKLIQFHAYFFPSMTGRNSRHCLLKIYCMTFSLEDKHVIPNKKQFALQKFIHLFKDILIRIYSKKVCFPQSSSMF